MSKINCCGTTYSAHNYARHIKTEKHQQWLKETISKMENALHDARELMYKNGMYFPEVSNMRSTIDQYKKQLIDDDTSNVNTSNVNTSNVNTSNVNTSNVVNDADLYQRIKSIDGIKIQKQFGDDDKLVTLNIRIEKGSSVDHYRNNLKTFHEVLEKITRSHKVSLSCKAKFTKKTDESEKIHSIQSHTNVVLSHNQISDVLNKCFSFLVDQIEERYFEGSGLSLDRILHMDLHIYMTKVKKGACHKALPFKTKAVINVKNNDEKCFLWSLLAALHPPVNDSVSRVTSYKKYESEIKIEKYPVHITDIPKIEMDNNLRINVFEVSGNGDKISDYTFDPLYISDKVGNKEIDILYYQNHYMYLKRIELFFRSDKTQHGNFLCRRCMNGFKREKTLVRHQLKCEEHDYCKITFPENNILTYTKHNFRNFIPFVIYADFESITCYSTEKGKPQKAAAVGAYLCSRLPELVPSQYFHNRSENVIAVFCDWLVALEKSFRLLLERNIPLLMSPEDTYHFNMAQFCYYCNGYLGNDRVRDHDHLTGRYRGAAHNQCNLLARKDSFIPIFFHNLTHYDAHLFIKELATKPKKIKLLAKNKEVYISFSYGCLRFLDSYRFLNGSLDNITESMNDDDFKIIRSMYPNYEDFKLLRRKGSVPYSFYMSHDSFKETDLKPEMFYNELKGEMEPLSTYEKAKEVWDHFKCNNHGEFIDLYLQSDVLLLADCFERFRSVNMNNFLIDPCYCYSASGLTWEAGLKYTNIKLELLTDIDILLFFETSIRGGISGVMGSRYVKSDSENKLLYIDANNLYGWAMMQHLPHSEFRMYELPYPVEKEDILRLPDEGEIGYFFEVDLDYPNSIKEHTKHFPFCPEMMFIEDDELSEYQKSLLSDKRTKSKKLMLTEKNKRNYIVHYRLLKCYLNHGMILRKVHKVVSFKQSKWLKPYIELNTINRMNSTTNFERDYFKLLNNSFFGKTCENIRNRKDVHLVSDECVAAKLHNKPNFESENILDKNLTEISMRRCTMKFNKPVYLGATILELSKLLMYYFYYDVLIPHFGGIGNIELLYMDTDAFVLKLRTNDLTSDLLKLKDHFDFSNYPKDHILYDTTKSKIPGYFKDELCGKEMTEFIALKSKMYAYKTEQDDEIKKLKGINRTAVERDVKFSDYYDSLISKKSYHHTVRNLISDKHDIYLKEEDKLGLDPFDDKRYILDDGISTLPFGLIGI